MKRAWLLIAPIVFLAAADLSKLNAKDKELEPFQGTWKLAAFEVEGKQLDIDDFKETRLTVKGDAFTMTTAAATYKGTFKIDGTKKPKTMDMTFTDGPEKGKTSLGIYEIDGDAWKICIGLTGKERPKEFTTKADSGHALEVLKREKP
jgi:uncharacterized protein (TIGR03067 family)